MEFVLVASGLLLVGTMGIMGVGGGIGLRGVGLFLAGGGLFLGGS